MLTSETVAIAAPWAALYDHHPLVQSAVVFAHLAGLMVAGGAAVAADRATLRVRRTDGETRRSHLSRLRVVDRTVMGGLAIVVVSGVLLFGADVDTYMASPVFWVKTALVLLLAVNGWLLVSTGRKLESGQIAVERGWKRLAVTSVCSLSLWLLIVFAGAALLSLG
jgi:uncharacterized membrane protein